MAGRFAIDDSIGAFRVWMDAHGVDLLILAAPWTGFEGLVMISAGQVKQFDSDLMLLRRDLKPRTTLCALDVDPALLSKLQGVSREVGAQMADLSTAELATFPKQT